MLGRVRLINYLYFLVASGFFYDFLVGPVRFVRFITKIETESDMLKLMVLKIDLNGFSSWFGFFG